MKLLIASDIHGKQDSVRLLLEAFEKEQADGLLLLGDLECHAPFGKEIAAALNRYAKQIYCVKGNCDSISDQEQFDFPMTESFLYFPWDGRLLLATHGNVYDSHYLPPVPDLDILFRGHTHVPSFEKLKDGGVCCNPGSASYPRGGSERSFMVLDGNLLEWRRLESGEVWRRERLE